MQPFPTPKDYYDNAIVKGGCWEWWGGFIYPKRSPKGYGVIWYKPLGRQFTVHRLSWILAHQQMIPKNMVIMHTCDNTKCYNPAHLVIGSQSDNVKDMISKNRHGIRMQVTHCIHGHEYTPENTIIVHLRGGRMQRRCRICKRLEARRYRLKSK